VGISGLGKGELYTGRTGFKTGKGESGQSPFSGDSKISTQEGIID